MLRFEDLILDPTPNPELLSKDFCLQPGLGKFLPRRTCLVRISKGNQVSLVRIHFSHAEPDGRSTDVGVRGLERDPSSKST